MATGAWGRQRPPARFAACGKGHGIPPRWRTAGRPGTEELPMDMHDRQVAREANNTAPVEPGAKRAYVKPEVHRLGNLGAVRAECCGELYDGPFTTRCYRFRRRS